MKEKLILIILSLFVLVGYTSLLKSEVIGHFSQLEDTTIYNILNAEITPPNFEYKGAKDMQGILKFIVDTLRYPQEIDCVGKVYLSFIVEKDKTISNIRLIREIKGCNSYNNEAIRIIRLMNGLWIPATRNNKSVRCEYKLPISFMRNDYINE